MDEQRQTMGEEQNSGQLGYRAEVSSQGQQAAPQPQSGYGTEVPPVQPRVQPDYGMPAEPSVQSASPQVQSGYGISAEQPVPPQAQPGYGIAPQGQSVPPQVQPGYGMPPQMQPGYGMPMEPPVQPVPPQVQPGYGMPLGSQMVPPQGQMPYQTVPPYGYMGKGTESTGFAIASMVLGIVSIILCSWYIVGLGCGIAGLVLGCVYRAKGGTNGMSIAGIVCSSIGLALGLLMMFDLMAEYII